MQSLIFPLLVRLKNGYGPHVPSFFREELEVAHSCVFRTIALFFSWPTLFWSSQISMRMQYRFFGFGWLDMLHSSISETVLRRMTPARMEGSNSAYTYFCSWHLSVEMGTDPLRVQESRSPDLTLYQCC